MLGAGIVAGMLGSHKVETCDEGRTAEMGFGLLSAQCAATWESCLSAE